MANDGTTLLVGSRKGLLIFERAGSDWKLARETHAGIPVTYAMTDPRSGTLWAGLDHGHWGVKLQRSRNGGETWEEIEAPKYPEGEFIKADVPATLKYIWTIAPGGLDEPQRMYIGTIPGGLFRSDDGGASWGLVEGLWKHPSRMEQWFGGGFDHPGVHSVLVDPRNSRRIVAGISVAGMFESTDGGATWSPRNRGLKADFLPDSNVEVGHDPHLLEWSASQPDVIWQQNHCGVFRTTDGGKQWEEVSESGGPVKFGFAVAVDAKDANTAWVVPAVKDEMRVPVNRALCVGRTRDGGKTWQALRKGLPQENCYDVAFRHALDVRGDLLAFGTTNGNLYASDDRGESWRTVANHLPPVYSVRFASAG